MTGRPETRRRSPLLFTVPGLVALAFLGVPLLGLIVKAPWGRLWPLLTEPVSASALRLSLETSLAATALAAVIGLPLAWLLAKGRVPFRRVLLALVTLPLVLPPVVGGTALQLAFGRRGIIGGPVYDLTGYALPFTTAGVVVAQTFVAMPFLVTTLEGALSGLDGRFEEAAATLGASRLTVLRRVTLPLIAPSLLAGLVLTWARALGEFGATITFAGNFPGTTQTMPLAVYTLLEVDRDAAIALSLVLLVISVAVLVALRSRWLSRAIT